MPQRRWPADLGIRGCPRLPVVGHG